MKNHNASRAESSAALWRAISRRYPEANFLQSPAWQRVNELVGHKVIVEANDDAWCLMIVKNARRGRYLEVPGGPLMDWRDTAGVERMFQRMREVAKSEKCVFIRLRPQLRQTPEHIAQLRRLGARRAPMHLHAEHTVMIDLAPSEEELLKNMRKQTRYEVRRAEKLGITVEWGNSAELFREFHAVQTATAARQHFVPPDLKMLLAEREAFGAPECAAKTADPKAAAESQNSNVAGKPSHTAARIYTARTAEGAPIAYGLILIDGAEAEYFEAASTELGRKFPGAYALQWQVMRDLKSLGVVRYNLWGIAPKSAKHHRYAGVTTFKTGFGGEVVEFVPAQDIVLKRVRYGLDWIIETLRKKFRRL